MAHTISKKITSYKVISNEDKAYAEQAKAEAQLLERESMHENVARPETLFGSTYKIKTPQSEHALYITINDIVLNMGTEYEDRHPYEIFINSKNMEHFQWVLALTRVISAVFRKGGDTCFLVDELKSVFDPKGGYFKKGGVFMPSLVAEIGYTIEQHLKTIGLIKTQEMDAHQKKYLADKRKEFDEKHGNTAISDEATSFPTNATICPACQAKAMIRLDNCSTCLSCYSAACG